jgi:hypothetical protein
MINLALVDVGDGSFIFLLIARVGASVNPLFF